MKAARLYFVECDRRKQMEAEGAGTSLVNKLVQAGLCFTKVNHEIQTKKNAATYDHYVFQSEDISFQRRADIKAPIEGDDF